MEGGSEGGKNVKNKKKKVTGEVRHCRHYDDHHRRLGQLNQRINFCVCILCVT